MNSKKTFYFQIRRKSTCPLDLYLLFAHQYFIFNQGHVALTATEMAGCTTVPDTANDAFTANIANTAMDNKIAESAAPRARSTALHAMATDKFAAIFSFPLHGKPTQQSTLSKGWTYLLT